LNVLILNGAAKSGKGTVVKYMQELFSLNIVEYSSIDYVKEVAIEKFGWDGKKDIAGRNLLAGIKQVMIVYNDLPMQKIGNAIYQASEFGLDILAIDIREPDEIKKLVIYCRKHEIECITCRILNKKAEAETKDKANELNLSDRSYANYKYDCTIFNNKTLEDLKEEVHEALSKHIKIRRKD